MKIYTKKGDTGNTGLIGGSRVKKSHVRMEAYGTVDELNAYIGLIGDFDIEENTKNQLNEVQDRLFSIGSILACDKENPSMKLPHLHSSDVENLENWIDEMNLNLPEMRYFILPGGSKLISFCHIARCVCRRAERRVVELNDEANEGNFILIYLNRLSDYLFTLGRKFAIDLGVSEKPWHPRK